MTAQPRAEPGHHKHPPRPALFQGHAGVNGWAGAWYPEPVKDGVSGRQTRGVRLALVFGIALGVFIVLGLLAGGIGGVVWLARKKAAEVTHTRVMARASASAGRVQRLEMVARVAAAPLPRALPLVERPGTDAYGYPLSYVDLPGLRSLLEHSRFSELNQYAEKLQSEFEADPLKEYWPLDAFDAFDSAEEELGKKLDAWVAATPGSFAPYMARGTHRVRVGYAMRGAAWASETHQENFVRMREAFGKAVQDLDRARALRPKLVAALRQKLLMAMPGRGVVSADHALAQALALCPTCFQVRVTYILGLEPRWGGSYEEMDRFARGADPKKNPRLRLLAGYADLDRSHVLHGQKNLDEALKAVNRACALGENPHFLSGRADILRAKSQYQEALADLNRVLELRPLDPHILIERARVENRLKRRELAGLDLLAGLRIEPTSAGGRALWPHVVRGLLDDAGQLEKKGDRDGALRLYDITAALAPGYREVQARRAHLIEQHGTPDKIPALEAEARAHPDDFRAHQALDYALARQNRYKEVIAMWDEFIGRNPKHGRAYLERGGAFFNTGRRAQALSDADRACELGVSEGCAFAEHFRKR